MKRTLTDLETMRAHELLVQRATEGLDAEAAAELARLGATDVDGFDLAPVIGADLAGATLSGSF